MMKFSKPFKFVCVVFLSILMSNVPAVAATSHQMISTTVFVNDLSRAQATKEAEEFLSRADVQKELLARGISPQEASQRLATLSDSEMRQMVGQMKEAHYGGDILVAILVVVLIIFLIKRM